MTMTDSPPTPPRSRATPVTKEDRQVILDLAEHYSTRAIARRVGLSRKIVRRVLQEERPPSPAKPAPEGKLDPFRVTITEMVGKRLKGPRILREIKAKGYQGGPTILGDLIRKLRADLPLAARKKVRCRFETKPGEEMQADWSLYSVPIGETVTKVHVLGLLLAHSRKVFYAAFRNERQDTLLEGLARGFEYFRGCALRVVFDNMATAVLGRTGADRRPIWHPRLQAFADHYGFQPFACAVRDPDRKGKKERSFLLLENDFIRGSSFASWDDLERRLREWLDDTPGVGNNRRHGTTGLVPNEAWLAERDLLLRLPDQRFQVGREESRGVDDDCTIAIDGLRYTVPAQLAGHQVPVRLFADHFEVLDPTGRLLYSRRYADKATHRGRLVVDATHFANLPRRTRSQKDGGRLDRDFLMRFPDLQPLVEGLQRRLMAIAPIHLRHLLRLADAYGQEAFLQAAHKAQQCRRFDAYAVKRILERDHPLPQEEVVAPLNGAGPAILGEVEEPTLDAFDYLDEALDRDGEDDDGQK